MEAKYIAQLGWYYPKSETDVEIARLEAEKEFNHGRAEAYHNEAVKYRDQVKNLSHLLEKMAERNQRLEAEVERLKEIIADINENAYDVKYVMQIVDAALSGKEVM